MFNLSRLAAAMVLCVALAGFPGLQHALADEAGSGGANSAPANISSPDELLKTMPGLTDKEVRQIMMQRLALEIEQENQAVSDVADSRSIVDQFVDVLIATATRVYTNIVQTPASVSGVAGVFAAYTASMGSAGLLQFLGAFAAAVALGGGAEILFKRKTNTWRRKIAAAAMASEPLTLREALAALSKRLISDIAGIILFFIIVTVVLIVLVPPDHEPVARMLVVWLLLFPRFGIALLRFILAPHSSEFRLVYVDNETAQFLFRNLVGVVITIGIALALVQFVLLVGSANAAQGVGFWLNLVVFVWLAFIVVRAREGFRMMMRGRAENLTRVEAWACDMFPWFAVTAIVSTYLISLVLVTIGLGDKIQGGRHLVTLALFLIAPLLDTVVRGLVRNLLPPMRGDGQRAREAHDSVRRSYTRIGRILAFGTVILAIMDLWDISLVGAASAGLGGQFAANLVSMLLIIAIGYLASEIVRLLIDQKIANEHTADENAPPVDDTSAVTELHPTSRLATLLPLLGAALQIFIIAITVLTALASTGVNVTAVLAGAGIFGIAIGFGSQKLVSDFVSGFFFLMDDAFRIGEYVDVGGGMAGTVEKFNLRSLQLRHPRGGMHCVPYGSIGRVTNAGREYAIMKLKFTVPFNTDVEKVRKLFKQIGLQLLENPEYAPDIIQTFKGQGVYEVNDIGIVVRGKYMTKPGKQFQIRKEVYRLVKEEFDKAGIQFARKEVHVAMDEDQPSDETRTVKAAAAAAVASDNEVVR